MKLSDNHGVLFVVHFFVCLIIIGGATSGLAQTPNKVASFYFSPNLDGAFIDPSTGGLTPIGSFGATSFLLGATAYDSIHRVEYVGNSASNLLTMNIDTGATTSRALTQAVEFYVVDDARGLFYGIGFNGLVPELRSIDVASGTVTMISPITAADNGFVPGTATFDAFRNVLYYVDSNDLIEMNVTTHSSRAIAVAPRPELLVFDRLTRQLFGFVFAGAHAQNRENRFCHWLRSCRGNLARK